MSPALEHSSAKSLWYKPCIRWRAYWKQCEPLVLQKKPDNTFAKRSYVETCNEALKLMALVYLIVPYLWTWGELAEKNNWINECRMIWAGVKSGQVKKVCFLVSIASQQKPVVALNSDILIFDDNRMVYAGGQMWGIILKKCTAATGHVFRFVVFSLRLRLNLDNRGKGLHGVRNIIEPKW